MDFHIAMKLLRNVMKAHLKSLSFCAECPWNNIVYDRKSGNKIISLESELLMKDTYLRNGKRSAEILVEKWEKEDALYHKTAILSLKDRQTCFSLRINNCFSLWQLWHRTFIWLYFFSRSSGHNVGALKLCLPSYYEVPP